MPKTRNVTRSEWAAASGSNAAASHSTATRRGRNENTKDREKENTGRVTTRTRTHRRETGLPSTTTTLGASILPMKKAIGGKPLGKGKAKASPLKEKKIPLQDITAQFLPAPEFANRGEASEHESQGVITRHVASVTPVRDARTPIHLQQPLSPLPPSSPPSDFQVSPIKQPEFSIARTIDDLDYSPERNHPIITFDPWPEFDDAVMREQQLSTPSISNSDPFGFGAVERRLKVERETELAPSENVRVEGYQSADEDLVNIPVADTSSPRQVKRLKRSRAFDANEDAANGPLSEDEAPVFTAPAHFVTPPTPHKDKLKRRRLSHEGHDVFSPCESSIESSPSPTKTTRQSDAHVTHDPLEEFNEELDKHDSSDFLADKLVKSSRKPRVSFKEGVPPDAVARNLRPRRRSQPTSSPIKRSRSTTAKPKTKKKSPIKRKTKQKVEAEGGEKDIKAIRERQARIDYFKRLDDYEVEKEDVFLI
ncbi:hypothetical protein CPB83DRAFT_853336 [Crepidotus variabilis]|uniref:Uncharacterized protein n=1 Tax=Crepidotus variabilis TaxID=179855 RepID=A0A9P6JR38_9AGAR|nr:hypothetical protein CPB83DRAFT_853336 [Crepidotus variabilis]